MPGSDSGRLNGMTEMAPLSQVGIVGYGAYVPRYRLPGSEISRIWDTRQGRQPGTRKGRRRP